MERHTVKNRINDWFHNEYVRPTGGANTEAYSFAQAFTDEEIDFIKEYSREIPEVEAELGSDDSLNVDNVIRKSIVRWLPFDNKTQFIYQRLFDMVSEANAEMWNFDITGFEEEAQYTEYRAGGGHYDWHLDIGPGLGYRKISVTVQLSEPEDYVGGHLEIKTGPENVTIPKQKGLATVFPSYLLHRVSSVEYGQRDSLVIWVTGPGLR